MHDQAQRTTAIGFWVTATSAGAVVGPLLGGLLIDRFGWGSVFLVGVPVMVLLLVLGPTLLPEFRDPNAGRLDLLSAALSLFAVLAVIYGLKEIAQDGFSIMPGASILVGLTSAITFVRRQLGLADPLIDLALFRARISAVALATYAVGTFVVFGMFLFIALYLQQTLGLSPWQAGVATVPAFGAFVLGGLGTPLVARRAQPAWVIASGLVVAAIGFGILSTLGAALAGLVVGSVLFSLGMAPVFTLATELVVGSAPEQHAGAAAAISETSSELGGALGIAMLGSLGTAVSRHATGATLTDGFQLVAMICAIVAALLAVFAALTLRQTREVPGPRLALGAAGQS